MLKPKSLWTGSLNNKTISLPELKNYTLLLIIVDMSSTVVVKGFGTKIGEDHGGGSYYYATVSFTDSSFTHYATSGSKPITQIIGIM